MSERAFQKEVLAFLDKHEKIALVWRSDSDFTKGRCTQSKFRIGVPDVQAISKKGLPLFLDLKAKKGVRRPAQVEWMRKADAAGCFTVFAYCMDDVVKFMDRVPN